MLRLILAVFALTLCLPTTYGAVSSEAADSQFDTGWYRSVRMSMWQWEGLDRATIETVLERIRSASGPRRIMDHYDTLLTYGPGHWTYEFSQAARERAAAASQTSQKAPALRAYMDAAILYTLASYPHLPDAHARGALAKAYKSYQDAGELMPVPLETWRLQSRGVSFPAFVHLPENQAKHAVPVVLKTGGMDVLSTEFFTLATQLNEAGIAMIAFDMPGNGNDALVDFETDRHHAAVLDQVLADPRFDKNNIYVWSESLGGHPAVRIAKTRQNDLAGVINSCGLLHSVHALSLSGMPAETDIRGLVAAFNAGQLSAQEIERMNQQFSNVPEIQAQIQNFQYHVYTNRVGADPANLLDVAAKGDPISLLHQGILGAGVVTSVPLLSINTQHDPIVPVVDTLLATQASAEGTMVLFGDHDGHCASRAKEVPVAMRWLQNRMHSGR